MKILLSKVISSVLLLLIFTISGLQYVKAQYNESYCLGKNDELISRAMEWMKQWGTATSDINGLIRSDGRQLTSEMGLTLVNCEPYLSAENMLTLTQSKDLIDASIDKNVDYGPPCNPLCESGPPIAYR